MTNKDTHEEEMVEVSSEAAQGHDCSSDLPRGWIYRTTKIGTWRIPHYASPPVQLLLVSLVFFLCPGMYNALSGLGGGGQLDPLVANNATVALYSTFATMAFFSGPVCNKLGVRITLALGGFGYALYNASFLSYNHNQNGTFVIVSGAILGLSAGLLYCAECVVMTSYPPEDKKGKYIGVFWMIFNLGAVIGSFIPLFRNLHSTADSVGDGTYAAFLALTTLGTVLALSLCNANQVVRQDGSRVIVMKHPTWKSEVVGLWQTLRDQPYIVALFPMFLSSNWFYTYQFNDFNLARFNVRTRSLNSLLYWTAQIFGALATGVVLDMSRFNRRTRARIGAIALLVLTTAIWGGGYAWQKQYNRSTASQSPRLDWTSNGYGGPFVLYTCYGFFDAVFQTYIYWLLGAISNNSRKLAMLAGFYKSFQSAGGAITFRLDALEVPYMTMFAVTWALLAGSLVICAPVIWFKVTDHTDEETDLKFSDEKLEDVQPHAQKIMKPEIVVKKVENA